MKKLFIVFVLFLNIFASDIPVDINNDIYSFFQRMENKNIISLNPAIYPFNRRQIAGKLTLIKARENQLSKSEKKFLEEYLADYRKEIRGNYHHDLQISDNGMLVPFFSDNGLKRVVKNVFSRTDRKEAAHLFTYENDDFFIWGDASLRFEQQYKNKYSRHLLSDRYLIQGGLNKHLFFHIDFFRYQRKNNPDYPELTEEEKGIWTNTEGDQNVTFDNIYSSFVYHYKNLNVGLYHQPLTWGTSFNNSMILTGSSSPFTYLGLDLEHKALRFSFIHGALLNDSTSFRSASSEIRNKEKYVAGHRIDLALFGGNTRIGMTEMIVYGDRNIEPGYLLPVNFYWSIEHTLMDRDNSLMAFDFQTNAVPYFTLYGTFFLDEMRFSELFNDWWANKHGIQLGARFSNEGLSIPMNWTVEMTKIRPWTYTHKYFINNYTNNGLSLGFPEGGNSQLFEISNETWLNRRIRLRFNYTYLKHGYDDENNYYGGDPAISYDQRNKVFDNTTDWLMGDVRSFQYITINFRYEFVNDSFIYLEALQHFDHDKDLFLTAGIKLDI